MIEVLYICTSIKTKEKTMQFELLNIIFYIVYLLTTILIFKYVKSKVKTLTWKMYILSAVVCTGISYQQFFTLTEKGDAESTQAVMLMQSGAIKNSKIVRNYLEDNKEVVIMTKAEKTKILLAEQQKISKALAEEIEKSNKENK